MCSPAEDNIVSNLESAFSKSFHIEDSEKSEHSYSNTCNSNKTLPSSSSGKELVINHVIPDNISKTLLKPVSAMKGSREKQVGSQIKLTVKWDPDVYDPMPSSYSLSAKYKRNCKPRGKKIEKKSGKSQKNTLYSQRISIKDKKQYRRSIGTSIKCNKLLDSHNELIGSSVEPDPLDSHQDSSCRIRFFKQSVTLGHYSVTKA